LERRIGKKIGKNERKKGKEGEIAGGEPGDRMEREGIVSAVVVEMEGEGGKRD
jgi:hypothetical protein